MADKEKKKKESIFDLSKYIDKTIRVKFQGGREVSGVLKGFDPLLNLVLDGTIEYMRGDVRRLAFQLIPEVFNRVEGQSAIAGEHHIFMDVLVLNAQGLCDAEADPDDQYKLTEDTRQLGLVVCRGTAVVLICPQDGMEAIPNPFIQQQDG